MSTNDLGIENSGSSLDKNPHVNSGVAKACWTTALICGILCSYGGWVLGNTFRLEPVHRLAAPAFNWSLAVSAWVSSFLFCLILFAIGEIVMQMANSNAIAMRTVQQNERIIQALTNNKQHSQNNTIIDTFDDLPDL